MLSHITSLLYASVSFLTTTENHISRTFFSQELLKDNIAQFTFDRNIYNFEKFKPLSISNFEKTKTNYSLYE